MARGTPVQLHARNHTVAVLLGLGTILVLPLAMVPLQRKSKVPKLLFQAVLLFEPI